MIYLLCLCRGSKN